VLAFGALSRPALHQPQAINVNGFFAQKLGAVGLHSCFWFTRGGIPKSVELERAWP